jgi:very-short-patch-repair endonuclease
MASPKIELAREMRKSMPKVEWRLWGRSRSRQLGARFRRQHPIGPYFADFACLRARLVIEVDGPTHLEEYDLHRDAWLQARGWRVLHVSVQEIDETLDDVVHSIYLRVNSPHPTSPHGGEELEDPASPLGGEESG